MVASAPTLAAVRPGTDLLAPWIARVAAAVLDQLLLAGLVYLLVPVQVVSVPPVVPGVLTDSSGGIGAGVVVVLLTIGTLMQAYLGSTPGKLVLGVAVVGDGDLRPVGLGRTLLRWLAHLLDSILLVGYLRPLWHHERRTFADSLLSTVVLRTRSPRPHRLLDRGARDGGPVAAVAAVSTEPPRWRRGLTIASAVACVVAVPFSGQVEAGTAGEVFAHCETSGAVAGGTEVVGLDVLWGAAPTTTSRFGVERRVVPQEGTDGLSVGWLIEPVVPDDMTLTFEASRPDGSDARTVQVRVEGGAVVAPDGATSREDGIPGAELPGSLVADLGDEWAWSGSAEADGVPLGGCSGTIARW